MFSNPIKTRMKKTMLRLAGVNYDLVKIVAMHTSYPEVIKQASELRDNPEGVLSSPNIKTPVIVSYEGECRILVAPEGWKLQEQTNPIACRLATKYALKKAVMVAPAARAGFTPQGEGSEFYTMGHRVQFNQRYYR
mgnify:CR=1 FL=1